VGKLTAGLVNGKLFTKYDREYNTDNLSENRNSSRQQTKEEM
jgi:hypothetical protein